MTGLSCTFCRQTQWDAPSWDVFADDDDDDMDDMDLGTPTHDETRVSINTSCVCCVHSVPCDFISVANTLITRPKNLELSMNLVALGEIVAELTKSQRNTGENILSGKTVYYVLT